MELAPFPCGRLPGFHRAISLHPSGCVLLCARKVYPSWPRTHLGGGPRNERRPLVFAAWAVSAGSTAPAERPEAALAPGQRAPRRRRRRGATPYAPPVPDRPARRALA